MSDTEDNEDVDPPPLNTADLPDLTSEFRSSGSATRADGSCHECDGQLWNVGYDTICANCSLIIESTSGSTQTNGYSTIPSADERSEHSNSEKPRCPGGFPHAYEWGGDTDDPNTFYHD